jgi:hypothetical protein
MAEAASSRKTLVKVVVPLAVVVALGFAFWHTVHSARSTPYTVSAGARRPWRLTIETASRPNDPVLLLEPPSDFPRELFDQVFKREMESMQAPPTLGIPLVLAGELERAGALSADTLIAMARTAGLESAAPVPKCMVHRHLPEPDTRQKAYFVLFDMPAFTTFRWNLATRLGPNFDAGFLTPALFVAFVQSSMPAWLPLHADPEKDCMAPIAFAAGG